MLETPLLLGFMKLLHNDLYKLLVKLMKRRTAAQVLYCLVDPLVITGLYPLLLSLSAFNVQFYGQSRLKRPKTTDKFAMIPKKTIFFGYQQAGRAPLTTRQWAAKTGNGSRYR